MSTDASQHQGKSFPLGATLSRGGANFSVFAKHNVTVQLLLFDDVDAPTPSRMIDLNPRTWKRRRENPSMKQPGSPVAPE